MKNRVSPKHLQLEPFTGAAVTSQQFLEALEGREQSYEIGNLVDNPLFRSQQIPEETKGNFDAINALLFGNFSDDLEIVRWSGSRLEWWGAFWWTVHNRTQGQVVVIAVSTTD